MRLLVTVKLIRQTIQNCKNLHHNHDFIHEVYGNGKIIYYYYLLLYLSLVSYKCG